MKRLSLTLFLSFICIGIFAQNDLMALLNDTTAKEINYTTATFKSTRIMNGHSIERMAPGQLDVRIAHRFGLINGGAYTFFGLDGPTNTHFSFEYGILKWLMAGVGRETYGKTYDVFAKFSILRQSTGAKEMPVSLSLFSSVAVKSEKPPVDSITYYFSSRLSYVTQVLIARKFNQALSFQITPTWVHRNLVPTELDANDLWAIGAGGRIKLAKRISLNAEYFYVINPNPYGNPQYYNPLSIGIDIETGGHVFQLLFTNSMSMIEKGFIGETSSQWSTGDIHFGFNISRVFNLNKHKTPASSY